MIRVEPVDAHGYKWRFFVDDKPTPLYLRKGGGRYRWQAIAAVAGESVVVLFSGGSRLKMVSTLKLLLAEGVKLGIEHGQGA